MIRRTDNGRRFRLLTLVGLLALTLGALPLTAFGATLLSDDFEDGNSTGWTTSGGSWSVATDGSRVFHQSSTSGNAKAFVGSTSWSSQTVQARVKAISFVGSSEYVAVLARVQNSSNYYYLSLRDANKIELKKVLSGSTTTLASVDYTVSTGVWYTVRLDAQGSALRGYVNGAQVISASDSSIAAGQAGVATYNGSASFDDVLVTSDTTSPSPTPVTPTAVTSTPVTTTPVTVTPVTPTPVTPTATPGGVNFSLVGYGAGTTGGAGGSTVTVSSLSALKSAAASSGALIIQVNGTITGGGSDEVEISSNKTVIGVGTSGKLVGVGLSISKGVSNVIIRNLSISKVVAPTDNIHIEGPNISNIWIDHNDLSSDTSHDKDYYDGALDITHGADKITVSWNVVHDHYKTSLIGHSDSNGSEDSGKLHVTYHHNYFRNVSSRGPSIRFGTLHAYNNLYENFIDASTGISSRMGACSRVENNVFSGVNQPVLTTQSGTGSVAATVKANAGVGKVN